MRCGAKHRLIARAIALVLLVGSCAVADEVMESAQPADRQQPAAERTIDPALTQAGEAAFVRSCTSCHDQERALSKAKSNAGWLATVQRMASKQGADISSAD